MERVEQTGKHKWVAGCSGAVEGEVLLEEVTDALAHVRVAS